MSTPFSPSRAAIAVAAIAATVVLTSCSAANPATGSQDSLSSADPTAVTVGIPGMLLNADVFLAEQNGTFAGAGLAVKNQVITAGANAVPQLLNGSMQFGVVDVPTAIIATQQGVGISVVAPMAVGSSGGRGFGGVIGRSGSGIGKPADLVGKKVAVNQLNGTSQTLLTAALKKQGTDPSAVHYVEVAPEQTIAALKNGRVDAAVTGEPLISMALGMGMSYVLNQERDTVAGAATFVFVAAKSYISSHPAAVAAFAKAITAANVAANSDPAAVKQIMIKQDQVPAALAPSIVAPTFGTSAVSVKDIQTTIDLMVANGQLPADRAPKPEDVLTSSS
ncbi:ABC transporter substrate-binding protein [Kutzneria sp. NPDC051319]|uniref:ABC transporter substrate-binding protein n=1 Tax=Kutzneria sp. NPDC051319 TaxID=3155047 RepID=UPI0034176A63